MSFRVSLPLAIALRPPGVGVDDLTGLRWEMEAKGRRAREGGNDGRREIGNPIDCAADCAAVVALLNAAGESGEGAKVVERESKTAIMFVVAECIASANL